MHELGGAGGDCIHFLMLSVSAALVVGLAAEDDVGGVFFGKFVLDGADCRPSRRKVWPPEPNRANLRRGARLTAGGRARPPLLPPAPRVRPQLRQTVSPSILVIHADLDMRSTLVDFFPLNPNFYAFFIAS